MRENRFLMRFLHNHGGFVQVFSRFLGHFSFLRARQKRKRQRQIFFWRWLFRAAHGFLSPNWAYPTESQRFAETPQNSKIFGQIFFRGKEASFEGFQLFWGAYRLNNFFILIRFIKNRTNFFGHINEKFVLKE